MRKIFLVLLGLLVYGATSFFPMSTATSGGDTFYYKQVRGKKGRKYVRHFLLRENLKSDKKVIYEQYGFTPHRLRFNGAGKITERWRYYVEGLEFVFDEDSRLIESRKIMKEDRSVN